MSIQYQVTHTFAYVSFLHGELPQSPPGGGTWEKVGNKLILSVADSARDATESFLNSSEGRAKGWSYYEEDASREPAIQLGLRARKLGIKIHRGDAKLVLNDGTEVADYRITRTSLGLLVKVMEKFKLATPPMPMYIKPTDKWRWQTGDTRFVPKSVIFSDDADSMAEACLMVLEATDGPLKV